MTKSQEIIKLKHKFRLLLGFQTFPGHLCLADDELLICDAKITDWKFYSFIKHIWNRALDYYFNYVYKK